LQAEAALAGFHHEPFVLVRKRDLGVLRQCTQDVEQLPRSNSHRARLGRRADTAPRRDLDLDISSKKGERIAAAFDQDIGKDRQRMASLDNPAYGRKRSNELVALCFCKIHCCLP
jgi:hypothetical protein